MERCAQENKVLFRIKKDEVYSLCGNTWYKSVYFNALDFFANDWEVFDVIYEVNIGDVLYDTKNNNVLLVLEHGSIHSDFYSLDENGVLGLNTAVNPFKMRYKKITEILYIECLRKSIEAIGDNYRKSAIKE